MRIAKPAVMPIGRALSALSLSAFRFFICVHLCSSVVKPFFNRILTAQARAKPGFGVFCFGENL
jgi:hypothetical protein